MLSLTKELEQDIEIDGVIYPLTLSYDNVLKYYQVMADQTINTVDKITLSIHLLIDCDVEKVSFDKRVEALNAIQDYLAEKNKSTKSSNGKRYFDFEQDAEFIYASFLQEYGIDLIEQQGIMRYEKFIALLNGLRGNTKLQEIIAIRAMPLPKGNTKEIIEERKRIQELKNIYALDQPEIDYDKQATDIFNKVINLAGKG